MRVFVAGASGAIGSPLVTQLVAAGHETIGMTRSAERAEAIAAAGPSPRSATSSIGRRSPARSPSRDPKWWSIR